ncbi:MAG: hypothetical protein GY832_18865 [Chloroflexi bacterium]|nr:hypothetical protein [Chloroflexota bacterium]
MNEGVIITTGYTRKRHWETIYHDLVDLYGPMIGIEGPSLWFTYKRFVQNDPNHILTDLAWPSHKGLAPFFGIGKTKLRNARRALERAGLITVTMGRDMVAQSQREYDNQILNGGKPQNGVITLSDLAALGIKNPSTTLFINVHDPLTFYPFCNKFNLTYAPVIKWDRWEMAFDNYKGRIFGPNRLFAAVRYIEDNMYASPSDRHHWPLVTEEQILSLLRCRDDDKETIDIRRRLLQRRDRIVGASAPEPALPNNVLTGLRQLEFKGPTAEVEDCFANDPRRVVQLLAYCLTEAKRVNRNGKPLVPNPAGLFVSLLREPEHELELEGWEEIEF